MRTGRFVIHELLWSFFLFLLLPVVLRGLVGAAVAVVVGTGQGRVLLPWLLKPEVAVEEGEKPPLTRAERRHTLHTSKGRNNGSKARRARRPGRTGGVHSWEHGARGGDVFRSVAANLSEVIGQKWWRRKGSFCGVRPPALLSEGITYICRGPAGCVGGWGCSTSCCGCRGGGGSSSAPTGGCSSAL